MEDKCSRNSPLTVNHSGARATSAMQTSVNEVIREESKESIVDGQSVSDGGESYHPTSRDGTVSQGDDDSHLSSATPAPDRKKPAVAVTEISYNGAKPVHRSMPYMNTQSSNENDNKEKSQIQRGMTIGHVSDQRAFAMKRNAKRGKLQDKEGKAAMDGADKHYEAPNSLDLFALETRARRTIGELIRPIIAELDEDRRKVAEVNSK